MGDYIFVFASLTSATRVKKFLEKEKGIDVYIVQVPKSDRIKGCSYGIYTNESKINDVKEAIEYLEINSKGMFSSKDIGGVTDGLS